MTEKEEVNRIYINIEHASRHFVCAVALTANNWAKIRTQAGAEGATQE